MIFGQNATQRKLGCGERNGFSGVMANRRGAVHGCQEWKWVPREQKTMFYKMCRLPRVGGGGGFLDSLAWDLMAGTSSTTTRSEWPWIARSTASSPRKTLTPVRHIGPSRMPTGHLAWLRCLGTLPDANMEPTRVPHVPLNQTFLWDPPFDRQDPISLYVSVKKADLRRGRRQRHAHTHTYQPFRIHNFVRVMHRVRV